MFCLSRHLTINKQELNQPKNLQNFIQAVFSHYHYSKANIGKKRQYILHLYQYAPQKLRSWGQSYPTLPPFNTQNPLSFLTVYLQYEESARLGKLRNSGWEVLTFLDVIVHPVLLQTTRTELLDSLVVMGIVFENVRFHNRFHFWRFGIS